MTLERGTLLHKRYRIVEILGQGGMGSVYRAMDENLGVEVALKENLFTTDEYSRQFRLEAVILANLRHPNLPRVTDHFVIGEQGQYLVMDYIEGEDLRQRMERLGYIPEEEAIQIGAAICDALDYLHSRKPPIIHRDVKPGNVKITPDGHIFLVDFGLAKVVQGSQATTTGARAMTPGYSPPEQYGTARTDARTDIYSLGATLYAALCGVIPEDGLARAMDNAQLTPLRKRNAKVSRRLAAAIEKAMAIYPEERFQTAEEFKKALLSASTKTPKPNGDYVVTPPPQADEEIADETPVVELARPITGQVVENDERPISRPRRKRNGLGCISITALLALFLILGLASAAIVSPTFSATLAGLFRPTSTPTLPPPTATLTPVLPTNTPEPTALPTLTPSPTQVIIVLPTETPTPTSTPTGGGMGQIAFVSERTGLPQIHLINTDGSDIRPITNMPGGACQPDWSPDGKRLVFISPCDDPQKTRFVDAVLYTVNADGSDLYPLPDSAGGDYDPAWSPDGNKIAYTSLRDGYPQIYVFNLLDGSTQRLTNTSSDFKASQPAWSRFGDLIVYTLIRYEDYQIWKMDSNGQGQEQLIRSGPTFWDSNPIWSPTSEDIYFQQRTPNSPINSTWLMKISYEARGGQGVKLEVGPKPVLNVHLSPDGLWLAFNSLESPDGKTKPDIYIFPLGGGERQRLTTDRGTDVDPVWRPLSQP